jgi:hypothetical protein
VYIEENRICESKDDSRCFSSNVLLSAENSLVQYGATPKVIMMASYGRAISHGMAVSNASVLHTLDQA